MLKCKYISYNLLHVRFISFHANAIFVHARVIISPSNFPVWFVVWLYYGKGVRMVITWFSVSARWPACPLRGKWVLTDSHIYTHSCMLSNLRCRSYFAFPTAIFHLCWVCRSQDTTLMLSSYITTGWKHAAAGGIKPNVTWEELHFLYKEKETLTHVDLTIINGCSRFSENKMHLRTNIIWFFTTC